MAGSLRSFVNSVVSSINSMLSQMSTPRTYTQSNSSKIYGNVVKNVNTGYSDYIKSINQNLAKISPQAAVQAAPVAVNLIKSASNVASESLRVSANLINTANKISSTSGEPVMLYSAGGQQYQLIKTSVSVPTVTAVKSPSTIIGVPGSVVFTTATEVRKLGPAETVAKFGEKQISLSQLNTLLGDLSSKHFDFEKYLSELQKGAAASKGSGTPLQLSTKYGVPPVVTSSEQKPTTVKLPVGEPKVELFAKVMPGKEVSVPGKTEYVFGTMQVPVNILVPVERKPTETKPIEDKREGPEIHPRPYYAPATSSGGGGGTPYYSTVKLYKTQEEARLKGGIAAGAIKSPARTEAKIKTDYGTQKVRVYVD